MSNLGGVEIALSFAGLALAYVLYQASSDKAKKNSQTGDPNDGLDPNFKGKPINPDAPPDYQNQTLPACQVFNYDRQIYENSGHPDWNADPQKCFGQIAPAAKPRYVDKDGKYSYSVEDPLKEDPSLAGKCFFDDGTGTYSSFPNLGGYTPPNRSSKLCFAAGQTVADAGHIFHQTGSTTTETNPVVPWETIAKNVSYQMSSGRQLPDNDTLQPAGPQTDQCQRKATLDLQLYGGTVSAWVRTSLSSNFDGSVDQCVKNSNNNNGGLRYWQPSQQKIVYWNPNTTQMEEERMIF